MKKSQVLPSLLVVALCGCKASSSPATTSNPSTPPPTQQAQSTPAPPRPEPKYGWKVFHAETFETQALQRKVFPIPVRTLKVKVTIQAESAIFAAMFPQADLATKNKIMRTPDFKNRPCSLMFVDKGEATCELNRDELMTYLVRDKRAEGAMLGGVVGVKVRSKKMAEYAYMPNKIQISLSSWQCIENCNSLDREVKEIYGLKQ